jgi:hypothetical protein
MRATGDHSGILINKNLRKAAWFEAEGLWSVALACFDRRTPIPGAPLSISPGHALG